MIASLLAGKRRVAEGRIGTTKTIGLWKRLERNTLALK